MFVLILVLLYSKSNFNDDDVEVGRCISRKIDVQCSSSKEVSRSSWIISLLDFKNLRFEILPVKRSHYQINLLFFFRLVIIFCLTTRGRP